MAQLADCPDFEIGITCFDDCKSILARDQLKA